jgi:hypothetical protein
MSAVQRFCKGYFSPETKEILKNNHGTAFLSQPCEACGRNVVAENKAGEWMPITHPAPSPRKVNPSGKSGYYKR